jgi:uncharacterized protein (TIGR03118 family)
MTSLGTRLLSVAAALAALLTAVAAAGAAGRHDPGFVVHNLVSNQSGVADHTDGNLQNAWGLAASAGSPWWVADNGTDVSTLYNATGTPFPPPPASPLVVSVPSAPTGLVASTDSAFSVGTGASAGPSRFIFSTETGKILGWHNGLPAAILGAGRSNVGAIYKGLAIANDHLYATDFHNARVDVFDSSFTLVSTPSMFVDPRIPHRFAPFGIQTLGGNIFVTYAKQDADAEDDVDGQGLGFVDEYDTSGNLIGRVASRGGLNAPWGLAIAPSSFGRFAGDLLVGNFGNGRIHAFAQEDGHHGGRMNATADHGDGGPGGDGNDDGDRGDDRGHDLGFEPRGALRDDNGKRLEIDGLWALEPGLGGANNGPTTTLFFTAGPDDEANGLFGTITAS